MAHPQETWIRGAMGRVATGAAFSFDRHMFVHKRPARIGVAFDARSISAGQGLGLAKRGGAMNIVAIRAVNQSFIHAMVIGPGKISLGSGVARIALHGFFLDEQVLWFSGVMWGVAVKAAHIIAGMR